jgi:hypothetical protein
MRSARVPAKRESASRVEQLYRMLQSSGKASALRTAKVPLLLVCAAGLGLWWYNVFVAPTARPPVNITQNAIWTVGYVVPNSAAARAGIRPGDVLDLGRATPAQRWAYVSRRRIGERIPYFIARNGTVTPTAVAVMRGPPWRADTWLGALGIGWMLIFAAIILWRGREERRARILALLLISWAVSNQLWSGVLWTPWLPVSVAAELANFALNAYMIVLAVAYAATFGTMSFGRRVIAVLTIVAAALIFVLAVIVVGGTVAGAASIAYVASSVQASAFLAALIGSVLCLVLAIAVAGGERDELVWAGAPLAVISSAEALGFIAFLFNLPWGPVHIIVNVGFFLMPAGLTYSVLARRVVDIGFVLNRAAVFTCVSVVIVGLFVLFEWLFSLWIERANRTASIAFEGALALALGMSIRFVHGRVDRLLDTVFFRKRHEDEQAIRAIAHEAAYVNDPGVLVNRTIAVLEQHADASFVRILDGTSDDPAIVSLRAWHKQVDLTAVDGTAIAGEWAYPMVARGRLVGALVIGPKRSSESYAPDESAAIMELAHATASALEALTRGDDSRLVRIESLLEKLALELRSEQLQTPSDLDSTAQQARQ